MIKIICIDLSMAFLRIPWPKATRVLGYVLIPYKYFPYLIYLFFLMPRIYMFKNVNIRTGYIFILGIVHSIELILK